VTFFKHAAGPKFVNVCRSGGQARCGPCSSREGQSALYYLIDELDAIGKPRGNGTMAHENVSRPSNSLLSRWMARSSHRVILMAATNRP